MGNPGNLEALIRLHCKNSEVTGRYILRLRSRVHENIYGERPMGILPEIMAICKSSDNSWLGISSRREENPPFFRPEWQAQCLTRASFFIIVVRSFLLLLPLIFLEGWYRVAVCCLLVLLLHAKSKENTRARGDFNNSAKIYDISRPRLTSPGEERFM